MLVFISYHTPDQDKARALEAALRARRPGLACYLAPRAIVGGAYWVSSIAEALAGADAVLFLAGRTIGPWQELEYYEALRLTRERAGRPRVVPVVTADQAPGLPFFAQLHQIFAANPTAPVTLEAIERALDDSLPPDKSPAWPRFQPYKGLPALEEADAAFFFGRDEDTAAILDLMAQQPNRIIALIGQSGVGKSSLARAGVLARLKSQLWPSLAGEWPVGLRDSRTFLPLVVRPGEQPLKELALAFAQLYCTKPFELEEEATGWARHFAHGSALGDMLRATRRKLSEALDAEPPKRFIVYLDQGEEVYTRASPDEARRFSTLVAEAAGHGPFSVLMSLRSDYYAAYQTDRALFDASERVDVLPLPRDVLREVIRGPALTLGARFESDDMADRVADATEREPGALPLLSDLMHEMWLHMQARSDGILRWSDNPEIIDVAAPLRRRAETFLGDPRNDEVVGRRLFTLRLAHVPETGEPVRRRARRSECSAAEWEMAEKLAEQDWRLLTLARAADGEPVVEVAHEQLLRRWPRLKSWLDDEREFLIWKGQVEHDAAAYAALPKAEQDEALLMGRQLAIARTWFERRATDLVPDGRDFVAASIAADTALRDVARRRRIVLFMASNGLVVALTLAGFAGRQWHNAAEERRIAEDQTKEAQVQRQRAEDQTKEAQVQRHRAEDQTKEAQVQRQRAEDQTKEAQFQSHRAEESLALATQAANGLMIKLANLAQRFKNAPATTVKETLDTVEEILDNARQLQEQSPTGGESSPELRHSQAMVLLEGVIARLAIGDTQGALAASQRAQGILEALVASAPDRIDYQRDLSISYDRIGNVLVAAGRREEALADYQRSLEIREKLATADPGDTELQRELAISHNEMGDVLAAVGRREEALSADQKSLEIRERLAAAHPGDTELQRDLSISHNKIGDELAAAGRHEEALDAYQKSLEIRKALSAATLGNTEWQRDLSVSYERIGDELAAAGRREEALDAHQKSLAFRERLATVDPGNTLWQRDLSVIQERIGDEQVAAERREAALAAYRKSLAIREKLARDDPGNSEWQTDLAVALYKIAKAGQAKEANLARALHILQSLDQVNALSAEQKGWIPAIEEQLKKIKSP